MTTLAKPPLFTFLPAADFVARQTECPFPPRWVSRLVPLPWPAQTSDDLTIEINAADRWTLAAARVPMARGMSGESLRAATARAYREIYNRLSPAAFPVRFWNFIPRIHHIDACGLDRYMAFNQGRFDAFIQRVGELSGLDDQVPTASGVGHDGSDLLIYCLASDQPGHNVGNPRQIAPYRYSRKYGPLPPCFSRATKVSGLLLVGGTASICGETSLHPEDLPAQIEETLHNLSALLNGIRPEPQPLACFREIRVYHARPTDAGVLRDQITPVFPNVVEIEFVHAELCRRELLVEIEGVAAL